MTNYRKSLTEAYREVQERELTQKELKRREEIAKDLPIKDFEKRYGKEKGMQVKMATATKMAKKESVLEDYVNKPITEEEFEKLAEKKDACYHKVKSRYKVWPSAYASGALVQCRKKGAKNWGNKSK